MVTRSFRTAWAVFLALAGCSLAHDLDGLEASGGTGASTADGGSTADAGGGGNACEPRTCADVSPSCGDLDDGCGVPLACGCVAPSTCEDGTCVCPTTPTTTTGKLPYISTANTGNGATWSGVIDVKHENDAGASATVVLMPDQRTRNLQVRQFDFAEIPAGATIAAVTLTVCRWKATNNGNLSIRDESVQLIVDGNVGPGPDLASEISWVYHANTCEEFPYVWQVNGKTLSLDLAQVQSPFFGAHFVAENPLNTGNDVTGKVDWMKMSVSYFEACTPGTSD